nr:uncharacterized mitochondrial protein AtMg00810-like [Tanacetum cinerariifolium]
MDKENPWGKDGTGKDVDLHLYRSMIRFLMYLTASRPAIMFAICAYARHQVTPKECHLHAVKRIFRYLKGHPKLGLWYPKESPFHLVTYSDSDYNGATQDRKSTTGGCQFLGRRLISWKCKKQTIVATSTTKAEYVAAASCCGQVLWIQNQLLDYGYNFMNTKIYIDNNSAIYLLTKPFDAGRFQYLVCKLFPLLGKLSTVSVFLGFGLTFAGTSKYWGVLRILMISLRLLGEGSGTPTEPYHTPSPEALSPSHTTHTSPTLPLVTTTTIPTVTPTETTLIRQYTRRARIAHSSALPNDRATIDKSSTLPYDSAPRVTSPAAVEGSMQQTIPKLTVLCTSLQRQLSELTAKFQAQEVEINRLKDRVKLLEEREGVAATRSRDDAPIKGRSMDEGEVATERISDDSEEMATVLTFMDAATVLASGVVDVPTGSGSIPTAKEAERIKRKGLNLDQESKKKQKTSEDVPEEAMSLEEVPEEKNFMHAPVEWKLYDTCGVHHLTSKDKEIFMLVEKDYRLRKGLALVMISYKLQVENYSQMANDLILKIYRIGNSPRQQ